MVDDRTRPDHLLADLEALNGRIGRELRRRVGALGLRGSQGRILNLVSPQGTRPTSLAEGSSVSKQAMGKRLRDLEDRGLVRCAPDPADGRAVLVHLTPAGERARDTLVGAIADVERAFAEELGARRYDALRQALAALGTGDLGPR